MTVPHERLTELFGEAIALSPDDRAAMIERVRADDGALANELASLLAADARARLATGRFALTADLRPPARRTEIAIAGYRILDVLGEGGMGTVYAAEQQAPKRRVAIKVLHAGSGSALARFQAEAEIMARLDHPGIARVLEAGDADGHPFFVMDHIDGTTFDRHVRALALDARLALFVAICDAVHHAHLKGVVHRDLKPSNVIVRPDGQPVVLDFGIAHLADTGSSMRMSMTRTGELIGTPLYMSPEQARLQSHEVDARTDVYTLGVVLYELACDELPYGSRELALPALVRAISEEEPIRLGRRAAALRGDLEAITAKALEKAPAARYQSVAALADDVRRYRERLPVSVRVPGAVERMRRFVRRRPVVAAGIAAAVAASATFATAVTVLWLDARDARRTADDARGRAEARTNQLVLRQARAALVRDPTEAIGWLATLTPRGIDPGAAWAVADEAIARGVAKDVLRGHRDEVHWVEPVGDGFVSGSYDGTAVVWQPAPRVAFTAHRGRVHIVQRSPSGELAIGGDGGAVTVIARDGAEIALAGHVGDVQHIAWSRDGAWLVTGDDHGNVLAWPRGRPPARELAHRKAAIDCLAFAATGAIAIAGDRDGALATWDLAGTAHREVADPSGIVEAWGDDARVLAVDAAGNVTAWHADGDRLALDRVVGTGLKIKRAAFAPDGAWAVLGGVGGAVLRVTGERIDRLWAFRDQVRTLALSPDARFVAFGSDDGELELRDLTTGRELALRGHGARTRHLAFARAGRELLSSDSEGVIRRWDLTAIPPALLDAHAPVDRLASDGTYLATAGAGGDVVRWTLATAGGERRGHVPGRDTAIAIAGGVPITGTVEGVATWWGAPPVERALRGVIKAIATRGDRVAFATTAAPIALFTAAGAPVGILEGNTGGTESVAFDPSGALLASGGQDRVVRVWRRDGDGFVPLAQLAGPQGDTHFVAFTPGGDRLISAGNDGRVLAWAIRDRVPQPESLEVLAQHTGAVTALAVAGDAVVSAGHDGAVIRSASFSAPGSRTQATLPDEAKLLALADDGTVYAVTRTGAAIRWTSGAPSVEIEHGARGVAALPASRVAIALDDGAIMIRAVQPRSLAELAATLARATSFALPETADGPVAGAATHARSADP